MLERSGCQDNSSSPEEVSVVKSSESNDPISPISLPSSDNENSDSKESSEAKDAKDMEIVVYSGPSVLNQGFEKKGVVIQNILSFLQEDERLGVRLVSKSLLDSTADTVVGPYTTRAEFTLGMESFFATKQLITPKQLARHKQIEFFTDAYSTYRRTIRNAQSELKEKEHKKQPALLHKLRDPGSPTRVCEFQGITIEQASFVLVQEPESPKVGGRVYLPLMHSIPGNLAWILAHIHTNNSFILTSPLTKDYILSHGTKNFSALSVEIGALIKIGYTISEIKGNDVTLIPPSDKDLTQIKIKDIEPTNQEIEQAIHFINQEKAKVAPKAPTSLAALSLMRSAPASQLQVDDHDDEEEKVSYVQLRSLERSKKAKKPQTKSIFKVEEEKDRKSAQSIVSRLQERAQTIEAAIARGKYKKEKTKIKKQKELIFITSVIKDYQDRGDFSLSEIIKKDNYQFCGTKTRAIFEPNKSWLSLRLT